MTVFFSFPSDHRNNPRNLLNVIINYIAACSFVRDTDMEEKKEGYFSCKATN